MEAKINNSAEQRRIRRSQSTLVIVGTGIMMFGIWTALKAYGLALLNSTKMIEETRSYMPEGSDTVSNGLAFAVILVIVTIYVLFELGIRAYIGLSAIAEGRGKRSGKMYIVLSFILIFIGTLAVVMDAFGVYSSVTGTGSGTDGTTASNQLTALIIDLTSLVMMIEMVVSAFRVKKYKKQQRTGEAEYAA